jgi:hypothetical protein
MNSQFEAINRRFAKCITGLESFMSISSRHDLYDETSASVLASVSDDVELERIEVMDSGLDMDGQFSKSLRTKRKLQEIRKTETKSSADLRRPLSCLQRKSQNSVKTLSIATYSEDPEQWQLRKGSHPDSKRQIFA